MNVPRIPASSAVFAETMQIYPVAMVHGLADARAALAWAETSGTGVTLLSAPGAALHAGCGWWGALIAQARAAFPAAVCVDILDCADATGQAMAALRISLCRLVLWPEAPARDAVLAIAAAQGGFILPMAPEVDRALTIALLKARRRIRPPAVSNGDKTRPPG